MQCSSAPQLRLILSADDLSGPPQFHDPRQGWSVPEFFERWYLPGKLKPKGRASGTVDLHEDALRYWSAITSDPPLGLVSDEHGIMFVEELPEWGYTRAGVHRGGKLRIGLRSESPGLSPLSSTTIANHVARVFSILRHAGPRFHPRKQTADIIDRCPFVPEYVGQFIAKEPWTLSQARQIARGCLWMDKPDLPSWLPHELWWKLRLALFYYTGLRSGTVLAIARAHVKDFNGELWLDLPGEVVTKTRKALKMPCHGQLEELIRQVEILRSRAGDSGLLLLPAGCGSRYFLDLHESLQDAAGLPADQQQSPHGWRRLHLAEMDRLGQRQGEETARLAGQHHTARTTVEHYVGQAVVNELRLRLPPLFVD